VAGRWLALNGPAGKVPSHGPHAYGQTYAIDLVHEPVDGPVPSSAPGLDPGPRFWAEAPGGGA
jgi:hypothetical protein